MKFRLPALSHLQLWWQRQTWIVYGSLALLLCFQAQACEITYRVYNFPPYSYKSQQQQWIGSDVALMQKITRSIDCELQLLELPFGRALKMLKRGKLDAMMQLTKLPSREKYINFVGPVRTEHMRLVSHIDVPFTLTSLTQIRDLPGQIAMQRDIFISHEFDNLLQNDPQFRTQVFQTLGNKNISELLFTNRVVGYIGDQNNLNYLIKNQTRFSELKLHPLIFNEEAVFLGISRLSQNHQLLVESANKVISEGIAP